MTDPTQSVHVRRVYYASGTPPVLPVLYDDSYDSLPNTDVLDPVLQYDGQRAVQGYTWDGTRQVADGESDPIGDALRADCVAYWKMDEASGPRVDATGNGSDLSAENNPSGVSGKIGNAASFSFSSSQSLGVADNPVIQIGQNDAVYIATWVKLRNKTNNYQTIISKTNSVSFLYEFELFFGKVADRLAFVGRSGDQVTADAFGSPPINQWMFVECYSYYVASPEKWVMGIAVNNGEFNEFESVAYSGDIGEYLYFGKELTYTFADADIDETGIFKPADLVGWLISEKRAYLYNGGAGRTLYP